ncbi:MAG: hypothetical protein U0992_01570 [Planctomycetaceae bacterium]
MIWLDSILLMHIQSLLFQPVNDLFPRLGVRFSLLCGGLTGPRREYIAASAEQEETARDQDCRKDSARDGDSLAKRHSIRHA